MNQPCPVCGGQIVTNTPGCSADCDFTLEHLAAWADHALRPEETDEVTEKMLALVRNDPAYWLARGWPEIRDRVLYS